MLFEEPQAGADHVAGRAIASCFDLFIDELDKMLAERDRCIASQNVTSTPMYHKLVLRTIVTRYLLQTHRLVRQLPSWSWQAEMALASALARVGPQSAPQPPLRPTATAPQAFWKLTAIRQSLLLQ